MYTKNLTVFVWHDECEKCSNKYLNDAIMVFRCKTTWMYEWNMI